MRLAAAALLLAFPLLAQHPHTSRKDARLLPLPKGDDVFHFVVFGDRTGGPAAGIKVLAQAVRDTNLLGPDLVMTVGDLIEGYNSTDLWMKQMREFRGVMNGLECRWFPVAGNHDIYWRANPDTKEKKPIGEHEASYEKHFGPLWYWFAHKNAAFFVIYTDEGDPKDNTKSFGQPRHTQMSKTQLDWLSRELAKVKDKDHVFVFCHHPRWIARQSKGSNWDAVHDVLKRAGNVSAVFGGHIHRLHYAEKDGIDYVTLATTGGHKGIDMPGGGWVHHFNVVTVREDRVTHATIPVGTVIDPKMMTDAHLADVNALRRAFPRGGAPLEIDRKGGIMAVHECELANPTARPIEATVTVDPPDDLWAVGPDHAHVKIAPGAKKKLRFAVAREPNGFLRFQRPRMSVQIDYLAPGLRVCVPRLTRDLPVRLAGVPPGFFTSGDHGALALGGKGCLRVPSRRLRLPDGPLTVEAWIWPTSLEGRRGVINKTELSEFGLFASDTVPSFLVHVGGKYATAKGEKGDLGLGRWQHVAGVFDGKSVRLYVDGRLIDSVAGSGERKTNTVPLYVGADPDRHGRPTSFLGGRIDEVRISKTARYSGESFVPATRHAPDADTVLLYHLDKDLGPFAPDRSTAGAHADRVGGARCIRIAKDAKRL